MCTHWFGLLVLIGFFAMARRRWHGGCGRWRGSEGCGPSRFGHGWHSHGAPWGGGHSGPGRSFGHFFGGPAEWLISDLHLTPEQERVVRELVSEIRESGKKVREAGSTLRGDMASALRSEGFDEVGAGELLGKIDDSLEAARKQAVDVLARLHQTLDPSQRARLADYLEGRRGPRHDVWR